jgi:hypothetical protein
METGRRRPGDRAFVVLVHPIECLDLLHGPPGHHHVIRPKPNGMPGHRVEAATGTEDDVVESFVFTLPRGAAVTTNHSRGPTWQPPEGVQMRRPESKNLAAFAVKLSLELPRVLMARTRPREPRPQGRRAGNPRRARSPSRSGGDPPESDDDLARPPLSPAVREFLRREIDRRRRQQLVDERDHLRAVPVGRWPA